MGDSRLLLGIFNLIIVKLTENEITSDFAAMIHESYINFLGLPAGSTSRIIWFVKNRNAY